MATQGACGPSSNQAPEGHTAATADWDAAPRKSTQKKRAQLDGAEGAPGCTAGAFLGTGHRRQKPRMPLKMLFYALEPRSVV